MDGTEMTRQMIAFQRETFNHYQSFWDLSYTNVSNTMDHIMDNARMPAESTKILERWRTLMKKNRKRLATYVDRNFAICEKMYTVPKATASAKTRKTDKAE